MDLVVLQGFFPARIDAETHFPALLGDDRSQGIADLGNNVQGVPVHPVDRLRGDGRIGNVDDHYDMGLPALPLESVCPKLERDEVVGDLGRDDRLDFIQVLERVLLRFGQNFHGIELKGQIPHIATFHTFFGLEVSFEDVIPASGPVDERELHVVRQFWIREAPVLPGLLGDGVEAASIRDVEIPLDLVRGAQEDEEPPTFRPPPGDARRPEEPVCYADPPIIFLLVLIDRGRRVRVSPLPEALDKLAPRGLVGEAEEDLLFGTGYDVRNDLIEPLTGPFAQLLPDGLHLLASQDGRKENGWEDC